MKNVFATLKKLLTIRRIILVMIIASILVIIFTLVLILKPNLFPQWSHIRESVITLATCSMVLSTLILAFGTFSVITHDRERENRDRKERYLNEILGWLREIEDSIFPLIDLDIYKQLHKEIQEDKDLVTNLRVTKQDIDRQRRSGIIITNLDILKREIRDAQYFKKVALKLNSDFSELINNILCLLEQRKELIRKSGKYPLDSPETIMKAIKTRVPDLLLELITDDTKPLDGLKLSGTNINTVLTGRNARHIKISTDKAIEKAIELKYVL